MGKFAHDFMVGAATAAHQVEGNNTGSDFWAQEHMTHTTFVEPSGIACDHYNRYKEDIKLLASAGCNAYRFSIEWARIEPVEGQFDKKELQHYRNVISCCRENGIEPIVTLHHFSSPKWLISKGGWEAETTPEDFARYTRFVMEQLGDELTYVCTINEANMGLQVAKIAARFRRQMMAKLQAAQAHAAASDGGASSSDNKTDGKVQVGINLEKMMMGGEDGARENMEVFGVASPACFTSPRSAHGDELVMKAHELARAVIRDTAPHVKLGLSLSLHDIQAMPGGEAAAAKEWDEEFSHYLPYIQSDDFLGVQNYTRSLIGPDGALPAPEGAELTQMDYEFYPEALEHVIRKVADAFDGDLIVTENGIATADDTRRVEFIERATDGVASCIADGIPVKGYFYWSLMDNFEWQKGFAMQFGVIAVDRATQVRTAKPSLAVLGGTRS